MAVTKKGKVTRFYRVSSKLVVAVLEAGRI